jgi:hypothetical protein
MVYEYHQKWRDEHPVDSSVWDTADLSPREKKQVKNMRNSKPIIPYTLEIECTSYWGSFEREFLGYAIGILDDVQMNIDHSDEERAMFWKEVFNQDKPIDFEEASESYELYKDFLLETFQDCDDWEQLTFYTIDWDARDRELLKIQLAKPFDEYWEGIIIPRMKDFFAKHIYEDKAELISIKLLDQAGQVVKEY